MITTYINYIKDVRGLSPRTCEEYDKELRAFAAWARPLGLRWSTISKQDIDAHTAMLHARGLEPSTIRRRITAIRCFYRWLRNEGVLSENPAQYAQSPKMAHKLPKAANIEDIDAYLHTPAKSTEDADMHCAVAIMLETGIRLSELLNMKTEDFMSNGHAIRVTGKGSKERLVYYGQRTATALNAYMRNASGYLFGKYTDIGFRYAMYRTAGERIKRLHPHQLRHTFAMTMLNNGMDIKTLAQLLGHASTTATEIYARATQPRVESMYNKFKF